MVKNKKKINETEIENEVEKMYNEIEKTKKEGTFLFKTDLNEYYEKNNKIYFFRKEEAIEKGEFQCFDEITIEEAKKDKNEYIDQLKKEIEYAELRIKLNIKLIEEKIAEKKDLENLVIKYDFE